MTANMIPGLVSTIIPVFNRPRLLEDAVSSVLGQDYRPIEVIVVDDGSTDSTPQAAALLAQEHSEIRIITQRNAGAGVAREAGRLAARGEFLQYLDSDDVLLPGKFAAQVNALSMRPECGVGYGYTRFRHADGRIEPSPWKGSGRKVETMFPSFLQSRWWDTPTPLYRASLCQSAGPWTNLRLEEDWEYDCRIAALGVKLAFCETFVAEVRDHHDGRLSSDDPFEPGRMAERARSHELILGHARRAGIMSDAPEMRHFARELFLLARQCGAAGLPAESRRLFELSRSASGEARAQGLDFAVYGIAARVLGWRLAGTFACAADRLRGAR